MSQTTSLTSEMLPTSHQKNSTPSSVESYVLPDKKSMSVVVSFDKPEVSNSTGGKYPDVRFACSNCETLDVSLHIEKTGEIDTRIRGIRSSSYPSSLSPTNDIHQIVQPQQPKRKRGRPKGSTNKPKQNMPPNNHKTVKEMFETNEEFKIRQAEELKEIKTNQQS